MQKIIKKKVLGIDFDNTIINYEQVFKKILKKEKIFSKNIDKKKFKKIIIDKYGEDYFTMIQSHIYGVNISYARRYKYLYNSLNKLSKKYSLYLVSHKTKFPIKGKKINLRNKAVKWMIENNLYGKDKIFYKKNIFFEPTIKKKINRIKYLKCEFFIDDLEKILDLLPYKISKYLFGSKSKKYTYFLNWKKLTNYLLIK